MHDPLSNLPHSTKMVTKMRKYHLNLTDKDIVLDISGDDIHEFESSSIYLVYPLLFGGFLAFDDKTIYCYLKKKGKPVALKFN